MASETSKGLDVLKQKAGPLPLWAWLAIGIGAWWYYERQQAASSSTAPNQQTDPAGNVGSIDPATGYVYGTPEDQAALAADDSGSTGDTSAGSSATSGAQTYADNNSWGIAAVNYLVGLGIDATTANQAVQQYLSSQTLTTAQQGDINLAIGALGPPPTLPGPTASNPNPVTTTGTGGTTTTTTGTGTTSTGTTTTKTTGTTTAKTAPVPTGLVVSAKSNHSLRVKWNRSTGATGYHLNCTDMATKAVKGEADVSSATLTYAFGNLEASHSYVVDCWAKPYPNGNSAHAEVSATLPRT